MLWMLSWLVCGAAFAQEAPAAPPETTEAPADDEEDSPRR